MQREQATSSDSPIYNPQFVQLLERFNQTLDVFTRDESFYLRFTIVPRTDATIFWKALIRVTCSKITRADQTVVNEVTMNLKQFLPVYQSLTQQLSIFSIGSPSTLYNSASANKNSSSSFSTIRSSLLTINENECCICMDRSANLVLPCAHRFCDECFHRWSSLPSPTSSQTCPICREDVTSDSGFILAETPKYDSMKRALIEAILSLPMDYKTRANTV